jgi:hypothetical protein
MLRERIVEHLFVGEVLRARPNHRKIPKSAFDAVSDIDGVLTKLFGALPS